METPKTIMLEVSIKLTGFGSIPTRRAILEAIKADLECETGVAAYDADSKGVLIEWKEL